MKTIAVRNASGAALDWLVAKCEGSDPEIFQYGGRPALRFEHKLYSPSTIWEQGGPIIEREWLDITPWPNESDNEHRWQCQQHDSICCATFGPTPLIAAMRCYVSGKLGDEVDIPEELCA